MEMVFSAFRLLRYLLQGESDHVRADSFASLQCLSAIAVFVTGGIQPVRMDD